MNPDMARAYPIREALLVGVSGSECDDKAQKDSPGAPNPQTAQAYNRTTQK
jgi:hypothetical protein